MVKTGQICGLTGILKWQEKYQNAVLKYFNPTKNNKCNIFNIYLLFNIYTEPDI